MSSEIVSYAVEYKNVIREIDALNNDIKVPIWYSSNIKPGIAELYKVIRSAQADLIYINGFYTNHFLYPLLLYRVGLLNGKGFIVAPRGMLQSGALKNKSVLKRTYLQCLKLFGLMNHVQFHATTRDESIDIQNVFGRQHKITVAGNIPKKPVIVVTKSCKENSKLKLIYLSLISEKKNLLLLLEILKSCTAVIVLDVYGPVKDETYWQACVIIMKEMPSNIQVQYKGDIAPDQVQAVMEQYDAKILLTKGENFGHALFESLSVGRPLITSYFTPWNDLEHKQAGWNLDIDDKKSLQKKLDQLAQMDNNDWDQYCEGAWQLANEYYQHQSFSSDYQKLFQ